MLHAVLVVALLNRVFFCWITPYLFSNTDLILEAEVRLYSRERHKRWEAAFVIDRHTISISTGKRDLSKVRDTPVIRF